MRDSNGRVVKSLDKIHDTFLEYWQRLFTHEGGDLRTDLETLVFHPPRYTTKREEIEYLVKMMSADSDFIDNLREDEDGEDML